MRYDRGVHRSALALASALVVASQIAACNGDDSSNGGSTTSGVPPSACAEPCQPGAQCFQPTEGNCNGVWYCWTDTKWRCAPPDASSPGGDGSPLVFPDGAAEASSTDAEPD
jgi:hypothetical protein